MHHIGKHLITAFIVFCISCICAIAVEAQDGIKNTKLPIDTTYANQYVGVAESLIKIGRVDSALQYVEDAASIYINVKAWKRCAEAYNQIGFELYRINKFEEAQNLFNNAHHISEENLPTPNLTLATTSNHLGAVHAIKGNYEAALSLHTNALNIQKQILGARHNTLVKTYFHIGSVYYQMGKYQSSLEYNNLAFDIQKISQNTSKSELAETYNNLGLLNLRLENYSLALDYYQGSLDLKKEIYFASHPKIATTYTDLALSYQKLGLFDKALLASDNALIILHNTFEENHPDFGVNYQLKGDIHFEQAEYKEAIDFYKKALDNRLATYTQGGSEIAETYLRIAKTYEGQKYTPMSILPYIQKAVQALVFQFDKEDIFENPALENILSDEFLLTTLHYKAVMFRNLYNETGNANHLEASLNSYQLSADLLLKTALKYKIDNREPITPQLSKTIFEEGSKVAYQLSKVINSNDSQKFINAGFNLAEQYKKYLQLMVLKSGKIEAFRGIDKEQLLKEKQFKIDLDFYSNMLLEEYQKGELASSNVISRLQKQISELQKNYDDLLEEHRMNHPQYFNMKYKLNTSGIEALQLYLGNFLPQTAMINYLLGDSLAYSYTITKDTSFVKEFLVDASLKNNTQQLSSVLADYKLLTDNPNESYQRYATAAYAVFQSILSRALTPIEHKAKNLIIARDGGLHNIPFEALLTDVDSRKTPFNQLQFLVKNHSLTYIYSASSFLENMRKNKPNGETIIGISKDYNLGTIQKSTNPNILQLATKLQHDWSNTTSISEVLNDFKLNKIYSNSEATKEHFLEEINNYPIAHLALLGYLDDQNPLESALLFSVSEEKEQDYSLLKINELYNTHLNLDLMVLSGFVETSSFSATNRGQAFSALQQALNYTGCLSTVASTRENDPNATAVLMGYFYTNLQKGMSKSEALTIAKRTFIEQQNEKAHPYFWSNHVLLGNPQNIDHPTSTMDWTLWAIAGGGIGLLLLIFLAGNHFVRNRQTGKQNSTSSTYKEVSSTFSNHSAASAITSTKVSSSKGDRNFANFTKFRKD